MTKHKLPVDFKKRQRDGIAQAKATEPSKYRGRRRGAYAEGRSPFEAWQLRQQGHTLVEIAKRLRVSTKTVQRYLVPLTPQVISCWLLRSQDVSEKKAILAVAGIQIRRGRITEASDCLVDVLEHATKAVGDSDLPSSEFIADVLGVSPIRSVLADLKQMLYPRFRLPKPQRKVSDTVEQTDDFWRS